MKEDDPALPSNPSNDNTNNDSNSDKADDADLIENDTSDKDINPETNSIKDSTNPESAPSDVNNDSNVDDNEVVFGEPLSNSTRKSDDEQDESDVDEYVTDVDDQPHIPSPTRKTAIVPDISDSSLPSLSGSLPSNNFFDQMMTEYDTIKMSSLTRNWGWKNLSMELRGYYSFLPKNWGRFFLEAKGRPLEAWREMFPRNIEEIYFQEYVKIFQNKKSLREYYSIN